MALQNRVTPAGEIVADPAKGTLMGNRGILHGADRTLGTSRWRHKAWIACTLDFKGIRRTIMEPGNYTELFFLDEATALAAGHRPCAECRRPAFRDFAAAFARADGEASTIRAGLIDRRLHACRVESYSRRQIRHEADASGLPDGAMILSDDAFWLVWSDRILRWRIDGYDRSAPGPDGIVTVVTPAVTVGALAAGYRPQLHESALSLLSPQA
ncbi:hypothetical protein [Aurantimonas sp. VKM B-3413]|uniref:hypothetical protein n=1 Tax=Aurantimonas sp. VKM B-3413 TaxID=2779401 RepID=UPI001E2A7ED1|nr:hypothetical protein [Aurantimonas sp. VKM B-3413]MCB8839017.1 hypothetical protein [Aurantimonas sp. VKM B-3413]